MTSRVGFFTFQRGFISLVTSIFIVDLGVTMTSVGLPLLIVAKYGISLESGVTLAVRLVPSIALGPVVGGILAKRDARRTAVVSSLCSAVIAALIPLSGSMWQVQLLAFAIGVTSMFAGPARLVLRPSVIPAGDEMRANGVIVAAERVAGMLGPSLVGLFVVVASLDAVFYFEAATAVIAGLVMFQVPRLPVSEGSQHAGNWWKRTKTEYMANLRGLFEVVRTDLFMRGVTITAFTYVLAVAMGRMMLVTIGSETVPHVSGYYGWVLTAMGVGGLCGGLLAGRFGKVKTGTVYVVVMVVEAAMWVLFPWASGLHWALVLGITIGVMESAGYVIYYAEAQVRVPEKHVGYYYAALVPVVDACTFLGTSIGLSLANWSLPASAVLVACVMAGPILATVRWYYAPAPLRG